MRGLFLGFSIASLWCSTGFASTPEHPAAYDEFIAQQAQKHGVPERLVHRIVMRESRYNPVVIHNHCFGLMQIKYATAQSMGYRGAPLGLLDARVNMTYAIPYLANAYRVADGNEDRAVAFFAGGYYYAAKQKQMLAALRTADSPPLTPDPPPAAPQPPRNPAANLFAFLQSPQEPAQQASAADPARGPEASSTPGQDAHAAQTATGPAASAEKRPEKSTATARLVKVAHKSPAKAHTAVAEAQSSAWSDDEAKAPLQLGPKIKRANARLKSTVTANLATNAASDAEEALQEPPFE